MDRKVGIRDVRDVYVCIYILRYFYRDMLSIGGELLSQVIQGDDIELAIKANI